MVSSDDVTIVELADGAIVVQGVGLPDRLIFPEVATALRAHFVAERMPEDVQKLLDEAREEYERAGKSDGRVWYGLVGRLADALEAVSLANATNVREADEALRALEAARRPPVSPEVREALPVVAHKGPHDTDESMFLIAADNLDRGYPLGGGNLTRAVVDLIRREVERARPLVPSRPEVGPEVRDGVARALWEVERGSLTDFEWETAKSAGSKALSDTWERTDALLARFSVPSQPVYDEEKIARFLYLHRVSDQAADTAPAIAVICDDAARALVAALRGGELTREETTP